MKNLFLIYLLTICALTISCSKDQEEIENNDLLIIDKNSSKEIMSKSSNCSISGPNLVIPGTTVEYTFFNSNGVSIDNGDSPNADLGNSYIDENGNWVYEVIFYSTFTCGTINAFNSDGCTFDLVVGTDPDNCDCAVDLPTPDPIYSEFGYPVPSGYIQGNLGQNYICTNTVNNNLSVTFNPCYNYSWSITPSGNNIATIYPSANSAIVGIEQPGRYKVILVTSNSLGQRIDQFILFAENCSNSGPGGGF